MGLTWTPSLADPAERGGRSLCPSYHDWEDDGGHCGLEDPEHSQAEYLHQGEGGSGAAARASGKAWSGWCLAEHQEEFAAIPRTGEDSVSLSQALGTLLALLGAWIC